MNFILRSTADLCHRKVFCFKVVCYALLISNCVHAQQVIKPKASLGGLTSASRSAKVSFQTSTTAKIISDPTVICLDGNCQIDSFQISVIVKEKEGPEDRLFGPFSVKGDKLPQKAIDAIKLNKNSRVKILIEDIQAKSNNKTIRVDPIYIQCDK